MIVTCTQCEQRSAKISICKLDGVKAKFHALIVSIKRKEIPTHGAQEDGGVHKTGLHVAGIESGSSSPFPVFLLLKLYYLSLTQHIIIFLFSQPLC
jgi:hypothetical protein